MRRAIEPQVCASRLAVMQIDAAALPVQNDRSGWPATRERFAAFFATRTRDEWAAASARGA